MTLAKDLTVRVLRSLVNSWVLKTKFMPVNLKIEPSVRAGVNTVCVIQQFLRVSVNDACMYSIVIPGGQYYKARTINSFWLRI
jgi:hypothetical protein